jgi:hypothetical protein
VETVIVIAFALFSGVVAFLVRPIDRRRRQVDPVDHTSNEHRRRSADRSD